MSSGLLPIKEKSMQLRLNKNPNTLQTHDESIVAVYLEITDDGDIEVCADTDKTWGCLLARITTDGRFRPNKYGAKLAGLKPDYSFFKED